MAKVKEVWVRFNSTEEFFENEEKGMRENNTMQLSDTIYRSAAVAFYDRYRTKVDDIKTTTRRNDILSAMQQHFEEEVRRNPQERNELSRFYELLKVKCWEV